MQEFGGLFGLWYWSGKGWHKTQELSGLHLVALGHTWVRFLFRCSGGSIVERDELSGLGPLGTRCTSQTVQGGFLKAKAFAANFGDS